MFLVCCNCSTEQPTIEEYTITLPWAPGELGEARAVFHVAQVVEPYRLCGTQTAQTQAHFSLIEREGNSFKLLVRKQFEGLSACITKDDLILFDKLELFPAFQYELVWFGEQSPTLTMVLSPDDVEFVVL